MSACTDLLNNASAGMAPALRAIDCVAGEMTASAFNRLFGVDGAMAPVLTILLTLYIAFFAFSLLTGRSSLGVSALTPRMLTLGLVLTFATSWVAYQGVLWNLAVAGPDWIAGVLTGSGGSATQIFADRMDIVFAAIGSIAQTGGGAAGGEGAQAGSGASGMFQPADIMWLGAILLLLGTVGVLLTARIALAVLLALGPVFVVMALFDGTRGLTAGWLRGVALTALTPLFVVLGGSITLELLVPVIQGLASSLEGVSGRGAMALFLIASVHVALMGMVFKVAGQMVAGWQVFGLAREKGSTSSAAYVPGGAGSLDGGSRAAPLSGENPVTTRRAPPVAAHAAAASPAGAGAASDAPRGGDRRTVVTQITGGGIEPVAPRSRNRAQGIGSRFRAASNDTGRRPAKEMIR